MRKLTVERLREELANRALYEELLTESKASNDLKEYLSCAIWLMVLDRVDRHPDWSGFALDWPDREDNLEVLERYWLNLTLDDL